MAVKEVAGWEIRDNGTIKHLHHNGIFGDAVTFGGRKFCSHCNRAVPKVVGKLASSTASQIKGGHKLADKKPGKTTVNVDDLPKPQETDAKADSSGGVPEKYSMETGSLIYFEGGRPSDETRNILKSKGFTFRKASEEKGIKAHWTGPQSNLVGTPFEVK